MADNNHFNHQHPPPPPNVHHTLAPNNSFLAQLQGGGGQQQSLPMTQVSPSLQNPLPGRQMNTPRGPPGFESGGTPQMQGRALDEQQIREQLREQIRQEEQQRQEHILQTERLQFLERENAMQREVIRLTQLMATQAQSGGVRSLAVSEGGERKMSLPKTSDLPTFNGVVKKVEELEDFFRRTETQHRLNLMSDSRYDGFKLDLMFNQLTASALQWFNAQVTNGNFVTVAQPDGPPVTPWPTFKATFLKSFASLETNDIRLRKWEELCADGFKPSNWQEFVSKFEAWKPTDAEESFHCMKLRLAANKYQGKLYRDLASWDKAQIDRGLGPRSLAETISYISSEMGISFSSSALRSDGAGSSSQPRSHPRSRDDGGARPMELNRTDLHQKKKDGPWEPRRFPGVSEDDHKKWVAANACTCCGSAEHWSKHCPKNVQTRPGGGRGRGRGGGRGGRGRQDNRPPRGEDKG